MSTPIHGYGTCEGERVSLSGGFHGIPELSKDGDCYVYWRGQHIDHYTFRERNDPCEHAEESWPSSWTSREECQAAHELAARCRHLEALGLRINSNTANWSWAWLEGLTKDNPYFPFIQRTRTIYEHADGRMTWLDLYEQDPKDCSKLLAHSHLTWDGERIAILSVEPDNGGNFYHPLVALGFDLAQMGQGEHAGTCYATTEQVTAYLRRKNFPTDYDGRGTE